MFKNGANCKSSFQTVEEERAERQEAVGDYLLVLRRILPDIVEMFSKVPAETPGKLNTR